MTDVVFMSVAVRQYTIHIDKSTNELSVYCLESRHSGVFTQRSRNLVTGSKNYTLTL